MEQYRRLKSAYIETKTQADEKGPERTLTVVFSIRSNGVHEFLRLIVKHNNSKIPDDEKISFVTRLVDSRGEILEDTLPYGYSIPMFFGGLTKVFEDTMLSKVIRPSYRFRVFVKNIMVSNKTDERLQKLKEIFPEGTYPGVLDKEKYVVEPLDFDKLVPSQQ